MKNLRWIMGGVAAGAIGAAVWAAIAYFANAELGIIAWGIGFCVGFGVRFMAKEEEGMALGLGAASIAVLAIAAGKYAAVAIVVAGLHIDDQLKVTPDVMITSAAQELAEEWTEEGKALNWPQGATLEEAAVREDFPPEVWQAAEKKWTELAPAEQEKQMAERQKQYSELATALKSAARGEGFKSSFSPFDILWFILAVVTAFKVGSGAEKETA